MRTLRDAANYITRLPKREHDSLAWRVATEALSLVAEDGGQARLLVRLSADSGAIASVAGGRKRANNRLTQRTKMSPI